MSTNLQPIMFDMDLFDGKKVPCTKYEFSISAKRAPAKGHSVKKMRMKGSWGLCFALWFVYYAVVYLVVS